MKCNSEIAYSKDAQLWRHLQKDSGNGAMFFPLPYKFSIHRRLQYIQLGLCVFSWAKSKVVQNLFSREDNQTFELSSLIFHTSDSFRVCPKLLRVQCSSLAKRKFVLTSFSSATLSDLLSHKLYQLFRCFPSYGFKVLVRTLQKLHGLWAETECSLVMETVKVSKCCTVRCLVYLEVFLKCSLFLKCKIKT